MTVDQQMKQPVGFLERTLTRFFMYPARVSATENLSDSFRLIELQGDALKDQHWTPGDKIQIKLGGGIATRTYTPMNWDTASGSIRFLAYCHGNGPGSELAKYLVIGDELTIFGPRKSLDLTKIGTDVLLFGDETSFGLAAALDAAGRSILSRQYVFEVNDRLKSVSVLAALGLASAHAVERRQDDTHLDELRKVVMQVKRHCTTFVLSGKASSVQKMHQSLRNRGVESRKLHTKAYWAPGKVGLD